MDGPVPEMVLRHEHQTRETMLQTLQLARLGGTSSDRRRRQWHPFRRSPGLSSWRCRPVAADRGRATQLLLRQRAPAAPHRRRRLSDRPHADHRSDVSDFFEGGGYRRREWWSDEGWAWKENYDITRPGSWTADLRAEWRRVSSSSPPHRPSSASWFEADASPHGNELAFHSMNQEGGDLGSGRRRSDLHRDHSVPASMGTRIASASAPTQRYRIQPRLALRICSACSATCGDRRRDHFDRYPGSTSPTLRGLGGLLRHRLQVLRRLPWRRGPVRPTSRNSDFPRRRQIFSGIRFRTL